MGLFLYEAYLGTFSICVKGGATVGLKEVMSVVRWQSMSNWVTTDLLREKRANRADDIRSGLSLQIL